METQTVGATGRICANVLTLAMSIFAAWGWCTEIHAWPIGRGDVGWLALAAITLAAQHIANACAAHAARAWHGGRRFTAALGMTLAFTFAGATAKGIEHAWSATVAEAGVEAAAPLVEEIARREHELDIDRAALRAIPANVPGSRIVILQAPLRDAIARAEAQLEQARRERATLGQEPREDAAASIFFVIGLSEPVLYWLLATTESIAWGNASQLPVPRPVPSSGSISGPSQRTRKRVPWATGAQPLLAALAMFAPGAAKPPIGAPAAPITVSGEPEPIADGEAGPGPRRTPRARSLDARAMRGTPVWLSEAVALRKTGRSFRAIARQVGVPKSTVARWLKKAAEQGAS